MDIASKILKALVSSKEAWIIELSANKCLEHLFYGMFKRFLKFNIVYGLMLPFAKFCQNEIGVYSSLIAVINTCLKSNFVTHIYVLYRIVLF